MRPRPSILCAGSPVPCGCLCLKLGLTLFPIFAAVFTLIPKPVLGGATLVLFGSIAVAGIRILANQAITRKAVYVMAVSFGLGLGVALVPDALKGLPDVAQKVLGSPITLSGLAAILMTLFLPDDAEDRALAADEEPAPASVKPATA
jgi:xanthine permease XanP